MLAGAHASTCRAGTLRPSCFYSNRFMRCPLRRATRKTRRSTLPRRAPSTRTARCSLAAGMPILDDSIDLFGVAVTCGSFVVATKLLNPDWPLLYLIAGSIVVFTAVTAILPGRRKPKKAD